MKAIAQIKTHIKQLNKDLESLIEKKGLGVISSLTFQGIEQERNRVIAVLEGLRHKYMKPNS